LIVPAVDITEKHFSVLELAEFWNVHPNTIRNLFAHVPDVVRICLPSKEKRDKHGNLVAPRRYITVRIPQSVAERVLRGLRGLGPRQTITVEKAAPKPTIDPALTGLERRQAEMRERMRKRRH
jgi:hypothetical protein